MKGSHWFIISIVAFLLVMFAVEYHLPKKFVWTPTFSHNDKQPFGCAVFDSVLAVSLPSGYTVGRKTLYQMNQEDTVTNQGVLLIAKNLDLADADVDALFKLAERGNKVMLVSTSFGDILADTLRFRCTYSFFNPIQLRKYATESPFERDSLFWVGDSAVYPRQTFYFYPPLSDSYFYGDSLSGEVLAHQVVISQQYGYQTEEDTIPPDSLFYPPVAMSYPCGKGEIILVSTPLLFTNYGMLDGGNATYIFRLLSQMGSLPMVRTEAYMADTAQEQQSRFRYLLSQRPLRWALYLTMITIVLFMLFTARRRQRAIPVVHEPDNKSLEFTELIGTLYSQKKDCADLVRKKFTYFTEELRREIQVDIEETEDDERTFQRIARKTGMDVNEIRRFIREIRPVIYGGQTITDAEMKHYIDKMNEIINHI